MKKGKKGKYDLSFYLPIELTIVVCILVFSYVAFVYLSPDNAPEARLDAQVACQPDWICTNWSSCDPSGWQERGCIDDNGCTRPAEGRPSESQNCASIQVSPSYEPTEDNFSINNELHWGHMPLTYKLEESCYANLKYLTRVAFAKIENETGAIVRFEEINGNNSDILVTCEDYIQPSESGDTLLEEAAYFTDSPNERLITSAIIRIYASLPCKGLGGAYPATEVHEILHVFGFLHNPSPSSIMQPYTEHDCDTNRIDPVYIYCLKNIYSNSLMGCPGINKIY